MIRNGIAWRGYRGFTLVEILVVMVIIAVLAAVLFPVFKAAVDKAHRNACSYNLMTIAQAATLARQDGSSYPAMPNYVGDNGIPQGGITGLESLEDKTLTPDNFWCDNDPFPLNVTSSPNQALGLIRDQTGSSYSFGYNYYGYVTADDGTPFPITTPDAMAYFMGDPSYVDSGYSSYVNSYYSAGNVDPHYVNPPGSNSFAVSWDLGFIEPPILGITSSSDTTDSTSLTFTPYSSGMSTPITPNMQIRIVSPAGIAQCATVQSVISVTQNQMQIQLASSASVAANSTIYFFKDSNGNALYRPHGLFQGLYNPWAPHNTILTFCPHHMMGGNNNLLICVLLSGEAVVIKPTLPQLMMDQNYATTCGYPWLPLSSPLNSYTSNVVTLTPALPNRHGANGYIPPTQAFPRWNDDSPPPVGAADYNAFIALENSRPIKKTIDWRINKAPYDSAMSSKAGTVVATGADFGDSQKNISATQMPIVQVNYRRFTDTDLKAGAGWYDTGIQLSEHDMVMVVANAHWNWLQLSDLSSSTPPSYLAAYISHSSAYYALAQGSFLLTADGDPVEAQNPTLLLNSSGTAYQQFLLTTPNTATVYPHCLLIGRVGTNGSAFRVGSRGSRLVSQANGDPAGGGELYLALNNLNDPNDASDTTARMLPSTGGANPGSPSTGHSCKQVDLPVRLFLLC